MMDAQSKSIVTMACDRIEATVINFSHGLFIIFE